MILFPNDPAEKRSSYDTNGVTKVPNGDLPDQSKRNELAEFAHDWATITASQEVRAEPTVQHRFAGENARSFAF